MTPLAVALLLAAPVGPTPLDVVHFDPAGPVQIRVIAWIGDKSTDATWTEAVDKLFAFADHNGDGSLDDKERAPFAGRNRDDADGTPIRPLRLTFPRGDAPVTRRFRAALKAVRPPLSATATPPRADTERLTDALFRHLDADRDGRLSVAELKAARERLAGLDADDDECLSEAELLQRPPVARGVAAVPVMTADEPDTPADYLFLTGTPAANVKRLLAARGGDRATSLTRAEFGADEVKFAALDQDRNGKLDTDELASWLARASDMTASIDLSQPTAGGPAFIRPGLHIRFASPVGPAAARKAWDATVAPVRALATVDRKTLEGQPGLLAVFDLADRDADGKLTVAERDAALAVFAAVAACRAEVTFADAGRGLFERLDANGDGRLSPRELADAAAGGDVVRAGLPRRIEVRLAAAGLFASAPATIPTPTPPANVPDWFAKTDRNGDGDVSRREFLGPLDLFAKLDADGDGLISGAEARR